MNIVFLGPPGAGKGTQCKVLSDRYGLVHLSSGDLLRKHRKENTSLGKKATVFMDNGQLVPDELIVSMMVEEINKQSQSQGVILDGFPRTLEQARELDKALEAIGEKIDLTLELQVDDNKLEERITGRRSCGVCGKAYHIAFNPPKAEGKCDASCGALTQRPDDTAEVVRTRIKTYHDQTAPLVKYYQDKGVLHAVDGNIAIDVVTRSLCGVVESVHSG